MTNTLTTCGVCAEPAIAGEWLPCMLCRSAFHFSAYERARHTNCGQIVRQPQPDGMA